MNVGFVVHDWRCLGCGTCMGVCPANAVSMVYSIHNRTYVPTIDSSRCTDCGRCVEVCPGVRMSIPKMDDSTATEAALPNGFGSYLKAYVGYATDPETRRNATSGGIATALSRHLLESKTTEAVVATAMKADSPLDTEPVVCTRQADLLRTMGSKYCPAATNMVLKDPALRLLKAVTFIGLPCHIQGLRFAQTLPPLKGIESILTVGLLCGGVTGWEGTRWVLRSWGIAVNDVREIRYRTQGWPGVMSISFHNGRGDVTIPLSKYSVQFFSCWRPWRCLICADRTAALADISLGDAWHRDLLQENSPGYSLIVVRNEKGLRIVGEAVANGIIQVREVDTDFVAQSQASLFNDMDTSVRESLFLARLLRRRVPDYGMAITNPGWGKVFRRSKQMIRFAILRKMSVSDRFFALVRSASHLRAKIMGRTLDPS